MVITCLGLMVMEMRMAEWGIVVVFFFNFILTGSGQWLSPACVFFLFDG